MGYLWHHFSWSVENAKRWKFCNIRSLLSQDAKTYPQILLWNMKLYIILDHFCHLNPWDTFVIKFFGSEYWIFVNICPSKFQISADAKTWGCKPKCLNTPKTRFFRILKENSWDLAPKSIKLTPKSEKINENILRRWKKLTPHLVCYIYFFTKIQQFFDQHPMSRPQPTYFSHL